MVSSTICKLIQCTCRGRIANFFFTPPPKDPQTFSRYFHLNRNKLGISMLFLSDFSIILKTVTCALINSLTAYNQHILEEEFCFRVSKYEKFLHNLKVYQAWNKLWTGYILAYICHFPFFFQYNDANFN